MWETGIRCKEEFDGIMPSSGEGIIKWICGTSRKSRSTIARLVVKQKRADRTLRSRATLRSMTRIDLGFRTTALHPRPSCVVGRVSGSGVAVFGIE
jgi:hypothetical protein